MVFFFNPLASTLLLSHFFPETRELLSTFLVASLLLFLMPSMLSLLSRSHRRFPATSPALLFIATSLSTSAIHPPSQFSLSSCSRCRPTATTLPPQLSSSHSTALSLPRHCRLSPPSLHHLHRRLLPPSWSIPLPPPLSLFFAALPWPRRRPFVGDFGVCKNLHGFEARRPQPTHLRSSVPSLFSLLASAPSSLINAAAAFLPPPLISSPPPYFSIAALPPHQRLKRVLVCQRRRPFSSPPPSAATTVDSSLRWASSRGRRWCLPHPLQLLGS